MRKIDFNLLLTHKKLEAFSYAQGSVIGLYQMNVLSQFVTSQPDLADIVKSKKLLDFQIPLKALNTSVEMSNGVLKARLYSNNYHSLEHASSAEFFSKGRDFVFKTELDNLSKKIATDMNLPIKDVHGCLLNSCRASNFNTQIDLHLANESLENTQLLHEFVALENLRTHEIADFSLASEKYGAVPAKGRAYDHDIYIPKQNPSGVLNKMPADLKNDSTLTNLERIEQSIQYNSKPYNTIVLNASHYADLFSSSGNEYEKGC